MLDLLAWLTRNWCCPHGATYAGRYRQPVGHHGWR